jgi:hypothetical protein
MARAALSPRPGSENPLSSSVSRAGASSVQQRHRSREDMCRLHPGAFRGAGWSEEGDRGLGEGWFRKDFPVINLQLNCASLSWIFFLKICPFCIYKQLNPE